MNQIILTIVQILFVSFTNGKNIAVQSQISTSYHTYLRSCFPCFIQTGMILKCQMSTCTQINGECPSPLRQQLVTQVFIDQISLLKSQKFNGFLAPGARSALKLELLFLIFSAKFPNCRPKQI